LHQAAIVIRRRHLLLLCCPFDKASLRVSSSGASGAAAASEGLIQCTVCKREFGVASRVVRLLCQDDAGDPALAREQELWESGAQEYDARVTHGRQMLNAMEIPPTLSALGDLRDKVVLELGSGTGRVSMRVAERCRDLVAVDFSFNHLQILGDKLPKQSAVCLVQADVTQPCAAPRMFDLAFSSQVVQALPTREHRMRMFRLAAESLSDNGQLVFTTYHHGLRNRLFGIARSARYTHGGIYRHYSTVSEIRREIAPYFDAVRVRPLQVMLPGAGRLGIPPVLVSRVAERVPGIRQLGILLLVEAKRPYRPPQEGDPSMAVESGLTLLRRRFAAARSSGSAASQG
jgi:predicted TPR repeat methyltransferase